MSRKPIGTITRGTTAPNRLRRIDRWLINSECNRLRAELNPIVVDLGYGATPVTAWELRQRLAQHVRKDIRVVGIEIDPERVAQAQSLADETLSFIRGGFEIPVGKKVSAIRALNVLRQYSESEVIPAWQEMSQHIVDNGLLIDGTCDEIGRRAVWVGLRQRNGELIPETLTFSSHLASLEKPSDLAPRLPKILIHHNVAGSKIHDVFEQLDDAWHRTASAATFGHRQHWLATLEYATTHGLVTLDSPSRWRLGEVTLPWAVVA
ncbi:MAG: hypothetical protein RL410_696 [Actinomycetota bacterium]|jgi:hypothetical protein